MKNMTYTDITTILKPSSMAAESNVLLPENIKINNVDLDNDALTFRANDEKTFTNAVKITDGLNVVPGDNKLGNLTISSTRPDGECYQDISSRILEGGRTDDKINMSPKFCQDLCFGKNFQYAGVQFTHECFCGNNTPPASMLRPISECSFTCPGDSSKKCGASWRMNVYHKLGSNGNVNLINASNAANLHTVNIPER